MSHSLGTSRRSSRPIARTCSGDSTSPEYEVVKANAELILANIGPGGGMPPPPLPPLSPADLQKFESWIAEACPR